MSPGWRRARVVLSSRPITSSASLSSPVLSKCLSIIFIYFITLISSWWLITTFLPCNDSVEWWQLSPQLWCWSMLIITVTITIIPFCHCPHKYDVDWWWWSSQSPLCQAAASVRTPGIAPSSWKSTTRALACSLIVKN